MKGLLLKDLYMMKKYCKAYLLMLIIFIAMIFVTSENQFFVCYPCLLSGVLPVNLLAYDERFKWNEYSGTLPYTRAKIVSGKYLISLFVQMFVLVLTMTALAVNMNMNGCFDLSNFLTMTGILMVTSFIASTVSLPFMFKLGVEKGRLAYFVTIGTVCGVGAIASSIIEANFSIPLSLSQLLPILCFAVVAAFAFSWYLSVVFYNRREF